MEPRSLAAGQPEEEECGREEPPLTVSEAAASTTTSFKDQSRAVDGPEPSTTGVGAA